MENTTTIRGALHGKLASYVEKHTMRHIGINVALFFFAGLLSSFAFDNGALAINLANWKHGAIPNTVFIFLFSFQIPRIARAVRNLYIDAKDASQNVEIEDDEETVQGIPTDELLDYLFTVKTFKRDDVEARFKIPRHRYTSLAKRLKSAGALVHGINNQTMLNPQWSRARLAGVLTGEGEPVTIVRPLPSPAFTRRMLSEIPMETGVQPQGNRFATACAA